MLSNEAVVVTNGQAIVEVKPQVMVMLLSCCIALPSRECVCTTFGMGHMCRCSWHMRHGVTDARSAASCNLFVCCVSMSMKRFLALAHASHSLVRCQYDIRFRPMQTAEPACETCSAVPVVLTWLAYCKGTFASNCSSKSFVDLFTPGPTLLHQSSQARAC